MKLNEMRNLSGADFDREVAARKKELMELRFQGAIGQLANSARVRTLRKEIAQLLTVQTEQQRQQRDETTRSQRDETTRSQPDETTRLEAGQ